MTEKKGIPLSVQIVIGLVLGVLWSIIGAKFGWSQFTVDWIAPFGDIFIRLLKMIAVPLVMFSIIVGVASLSTYVSWAVWVVGPYSPIWGPR